MTKLPPEKTKELRGLILFFLFNIYPCDISKVSVYKSFYQYWRIDHIDKALSYLNEKGYAEMKKYRDPFGSSFEMIENWKITTAGIDLCEGTTKDEGVLSNLGR